MRRGVTIAVVLVLVVSTILSVLLFQVTQPGSTIFGQNVITETVTMPNPAVNASQSGQVILETYNWNILTSLVLTLRNIGPNPVMLADWYINGEQIGQIVAAGDCVGTNTFFAAGTACTVTLPVQEYTVDASVPYTVKVVTVDGQIFSYCIIAGDSDMTPLSMNDCTQPKIIMEAYDWTMPYDLALTLRNVGPVNVQFSDFFINGALVGTVAGSCATGGTLAGTLAVGSSCVATLTSPSTPSQGESYIIKIVTIDGSVFSFTVKAGSSA